MNMCHWVKLHVMIDVPSARYIVLAIYLHVYTYFSLGDFISIIRLGHTCV